VEAALKDFLQFYRSNDLDKQLGWNTDNSRHPETWNLALGHYREPFTKQHQELVAALRLEVWRDTESLRAFLDLLRESGDADLIRIGTLYVGGPGIGNCPMELNGADKSFATDMIRQMVEESNPVLRIVLARALAYVAGFPYPPDELRALLGVAGTEAVPATLDGLFNILGVHLPRSQDVRSFFISQATQPEAFGPDRTRQLKAAFLLCYLPSNRDIPEVFTTALTLLGRTSDPELVRAAVPYLNRIGQGPNPPPDLTNSNPQAVAVFKGLLNAYAEIQPREDADPLPQVVRGEIAQKIAQFDMPDACKFLEGYMSDPSANEDDKVQLLFGVGFASYYSGTNVFNNTEQQWGDLLTRLAASESASSRLRVEAYGKLMLFQMRYLDTDEEGVIRRINAVIGQMLSDRNPEVRQAGETDLERVKALGLFR
jgi:hypothetical protein